MIAVENTKENILINRCHDNSNINLTCFLLHDIIEKTMRYNIQNIKFIDTANVSVLSHVSYILKADVSAKNNYSVKLYYEYNS